MGKKWDEPGSIASIVLSSSSISQQQQQEKHPIQSKQQHQYGTTKSPVDPKNDEIWTEQISIQENNSDGLKGAAAYVSNTKSSSTAISALDQTSRTDAGMKISNITTNNNNNKNNIPSSNNRQTRADVVDPSTKPSVHYFLGIPLLFISNNNNNEDPSNAPAITSSVHCVGDNFSPRHAWKYRSCQFQHLCWHRREVVIGGVVPNSKEGETLDKREEGEFVLVPSTTQLELERALDAWNNTHARIMSTRMNVGDGGSGLALGGLSLMTARKGRFQWFPKMISLDHVNHHQNGFYQLENTIWIPFDVQYTNLATSRTAMLFDFIFPLYNLLAMFGWERGNALRQRILLTHMNYQQDCGSNSDCQNQLLQYISLLGPNVVLHTLYDGDDMMTDEEEQQQQQQQEYFDNGNEYEEPWDNNNNVIRQRPSSSTSLFKLAATLSSSKNNDGNESNNNALICAPRGAAGLGFLTDHGWKRHGTKASDYRESRNVGRGRLFYKFRVDALKHMGIHTANYHVQSFGNMRILINFDSSTNVAGDGPDVVEDEEDEPKKRTSPLQEIADMLNHFLDTHINGTVFAHSEVEILSTELSNHTLYDQLQWVSQSCIYVCINNGSGMAAFLPRGASLILFYDDQEFVVQDAGKKRKKGTKRREKPVMLDWDLWNHMSHLHVHWLPLSSLKEREGRQALMDIVQMELSRIHRRRHPPSGDVVANQPPPNRGTVDGLNVVHVPNRLPWSSTHCIGDNFQVDAALYRSCHYEHLCFDMEQMGFVTFSMNNSNTSRNRTKFQYYLSSHNKRVLIGHNARLAIPENVSWSPIQLKFSNEWERKGYYQLPSNVVWVPFFGETPNIMNPGHLLWDNFLPIYTLASLFGLLDYDDISSNNLDEKKLLLTNLEHVDCIPEKPEMCYNLIAKFLPLMGVKERLSNDLNIELKLPDGAPQSNLVCGQGVAGVGMLTDHALQRHGQGSVDYEYVVNTGRGSLFYDFRNYLLRNIQTKHYDAQLWSRLPFRITVSVSSSQTPSRNRDFRKQIKRLEREFPKEQVLVQSFRMSQLPLTEQIRIATESAVYMSVIGGATVTATFLPKGASLILFVNDIDQFIDDDPEQGPVYMDWDFWNNASYLRVHWMTISTMDTPADLNVLVKLVRNEMAILQKP